MGIHSAIFIRYLALKELAFSFPLLEIYYIVLELHRVLSTNLRHFMWASVITLRDYDSETKEQNCETMQGNKCNCARKLNQTSHKNMLHKIQLREDTIYQIMQNKTQTTAFCPFPLK